MADDAFEQQMLDGEEYDETIRGEAANPPVDEEPESHDRDYDDPTAVSSSRAPEGYADRDEEWADDDPADVPPEHGGEREGLDTDGNGVLDTLLPEGTDDIFDENA